ncbi:MAG: N-acetylmuramoyl-L-alanine amidase [Acidobacteria bacterium]|nr:N-acetylmuramoyl-L-alanine amidase [Acidobacteriota bacterium]
MMQSTIPTEPPVIDRTAFRLPEGEFINQSVPKDMIVLHYTAGSSAASVYQTWMGAGGGSVATAYVIDLDGRIYEFFSPDRWAYHLGMKEMNPGHYHDRRSIGIELVNVGPLKPDAEKADQLNWWPNEYTTAWCKTGETEKYTRAVFRGCRYFAAFPDAQVESAKWLVQHLCEEFKIPRVLPPRAKREEYDPRFFCRYQGVASHQNFRPDKLDVGPAWDWNRLGI